MGRCVPECLLKQFLVGSGTVSLGYGFVPELAWIKCATVRIVPQGVRCVCVWWGGCVIFDCSGAG